MPAPGSGAAAAAPSSSETWSLLSESPPDASPAPSAEAPPSFAARHPPGLLVLFLTEACERFSYYGMRALLVLYMVNVLFRADNAAVRPWGTGAALALFGDPDAGAAGWPEAAPRPFSCPGDALPCAREVAVQQLASRVYGSYTALVYLTPVVGGAVADRYTGQRTMVVVGGVLMATGHFLMAFPRAFFLALAFLVAGNGAFKPNCTVQLGRLYRVSGGASQAQLRQEAYNIFYCGINLGAFCAPIVAGALRAAVGDGGARYCAPGSGGACLVGKDADINGYHAGFTAAGVGMCVSLVIYVLGGAHIAPDDIPPPNLQRAWLALRRACAHARGGGAKARGYLHGADAADPPPPPPARDAPPLGALLRQHRSRALAFLVVVMGVVLFWGVYEQSGNTVQLFASTETNRFVFGFEVPGEWIQAINPLFIIAFTPVLSSAAAAFARRWSEPHALTKMAAGCLLTGAAQVIMALAAAAVAVRRDANGRLAFAAKAPLWMLVLAIAVQTVGELLLSPVGLNFATQVAPAGLNGVFVGVWMTSSFAGNFIAGVLGTMYSEFGESHAPFFLMLALIAGGNAAVFFVLRTPLRRVLDQPHGDGG